MSQPEREEAGEGARGPDVPDDLPRRRVARPGDRLPTAMGEAGPAMRRRGTRPGGTRSTRLGRAARPEGRARLSDAVLRPVQGQAGDHGPGEACLRRRPVLRLVVPDVP